MWIYLWWILMLSSVGRSSSREMWVSQAGVPGKGRPAMLDTPSPVGKAVLRPAKCISSGLGGEAPAVLVLLSKAAPGLVGSYYNFAA
jgi:hypothetical protein